LPQCRLLAKDCVSGPKSHGGHVAAGALASLGGNKKGGGESTVNRRERLAADIGDAKRRTRDQRSGQLPRW
jgi:hypothetical protein